MAESQSLWQRFLTACPADTREILAAYEQEPLRKLLRLRLEMDVYRQQLDRFEQDPDVSVDVGDMAHEACTNLLNRWEASDAEGQRVIQAAVLYFAEADDAIADTDDWTGFADDLEVITAAEAVLAS